MSRPPILPLPDVQAQVLMHEMPVLLEAHPFDGISHRHFVRAFIGLVYRATGRTFNPSIYRKLLAVYAPGRGPSTSVLEQEKLSFLQEQQRPAAIAREDGLPGTGGNRGEFAGDHLAALIERTIRKALSGNTKSGATENEVAMRERIEYQQQQVLLSEQAALDARMQAAALGAELQQAKASLVALQEQIDSAHALLVQFGAGIDRLTDELAGMRNFAMNAIDSVRAETRTWQHRAHVLEAQLKEAKGHMEIFRQAAYARGAPIPKGILEGRV